MLGYVIASQNQELLEHSKRMWLTPPSTATCECVAFWHSIKQVTVWRVSATLEYPGDLGRMSPTIPIIQDSIVFDCVERTVTLPTEKVWLGPDF